MESGQEHTKSERRTEVLVMLGLAVLGIAFYFYRFGWQHFQPTSVQWMLGGGDSSTYYIGWTFYRHEPWGWPLGRIDGYLAPLGTSVPMVDALPLVAIPLKLVARWLPDHFQYFGLWTCLSHALQAVFGYLLMGHVTRRRSLRVMGALFLLMATPLLKRSTHVALASHWILLAALTAYFRLADATLRVRLLAWGALVAIAACVHPYLTVMTLGIAAAAWVRAAITAHGRQRLLALAVPVGLLALTGLIFGASGHFVYAGDSGGGMNGYGQFSLNLNALINPMHSSQFLKTMPWLSPDQAEGVNYAGLGMLGLGLLALACLAARPVLLREAGRHGPLIIVLLIFAIFAVSNRISWGDHVLMTYPVPPQLDQLLASLRSSGRFFWPVLYTMMFVVLWVLQRELPPRLVVVVVAMGLVVQGLDLWRNVEVRGIAAATYETTLRNPDWDVAAARADTLFMYPPFQRDFERKGDFKHFSWLAARHRLPVTTGYSARLPRQAAEDYRAHLDAQLTRGDLDPRGLYVIQAADLARSYAAVSDKGWRADRWDGYYVLVSPKFDVPVSGSLAAITTTSLGDYLSTHAGDILLLAVKDEARAHLTEQDREALRALGGHIDELDYRGAYAAVIARGKLRFEQVSNDGAVDERLAAGTPIAGWTPPVDIHLRSAGYEHGNLASITVGGTEVGLGSRGFNVVQLDAAGHPVAAGAFDTHAGGPGYVLDLRSAGR